MSESVTKEYIVKAAGDNESRELRFNKLSNGNYQLKVHWGRRDRTLATLNFTPREWAKLASFAEGLKRK